MMIAEFSVSIRLTLTSFAEQRFLRAMLLLICVLIFILIATMMGKNSFVHKTEDKPENNGEEEDNGEN